VARDPRNKLFDIHNNDNFNDGNVLIALKTDVLIFILQIFTLNFFTLKALYFFNTFKSFLNTCYKCFILFVMVWEFYFCAVMIYFALRLSYFTLRLSYFDEIVRQTMTRLPNICRPFQFSCKHWFFCDSQLLYCIPNLTIVIEIKPCNWVHDNMQSSSFKNMQHLLHWLFGGGGSDHDHRTLGIFK
jgi:hypothetical protein